MYEKSEYHPLLWQGLEGEGRCQISLTLLDTGQGINGLLVGGEKPHIGGVVLALPRPSLTGQGWSEDVFITPVPGHKDVDVARSVAGLLARHLQCTVVVTAGIHSEHLSPEELRLIVDHCDKLAYAALEVIKKSD